jgi:hypothetical protein
MPFSPLPALQQSALLIAAGIFVTTATQIASAQAPGKHERFEKIDPMVFFVARGARDSCGKGCNTWIAAEGDFVPNTAATFRQFVEIGSRRSLPVFFHSWGGRAEQAFAVGNILREKKMTAAVGQTIPLGCNVASFADKSCRQRIESASELNAKLYLARGLCVSACVYGILGASARQIHPEARLAIHSPAVARQVRDGVIALSEPGPDLGATTHNALKFRIVGMGVDPAIIDLAAKVRSNSLHYLSREEIAKFGIVISGSFETGWFAHHRANVGYAIVKSLTRPARLSDGKYLTTRIQIGCFFGQGSAFVVALEREYEEQEAADEVVVRVTSDSGFAWETKQRQGDSPRASEQVDLRRRHYSAKDLLQLAASREIEIKETGSNWTSEARISTNALLDALRSTPKDCMTVE